MKFTAKHVTLEVELVQIDGTERKLVTPALKAEDAAKLLDRLIKEDDEFDKGHADKSKPIYSDMAKNYAEQLAAIYNVEPQYWLDNFDSTTIADVKRYVINELLGVKKKA